MASMYRVENKLFEASVVEGIDFCVNESDHGESRAFIILYVP